VAIELMERRGSKLESMGFFITSINFLMILKASEAFTKKLRDFQPVLG
jgi:hypothetical protein